MEELTSLFLEVATLKRMPRTGWGMRGVPHVESVAEHSFGVAFVSLVLFDALRSEAMPDGNRGPLDRERVLIMALLHDLGEVRLTDLPSTAVHLIPEGVKSAAESQAVADLLAPLPTANLLRDMWQEFEDHASPEGRLVRDADKLEMMVQCLRYEQAGSRGLDEFWQAMDQRAWEYPLCARLYEDLRSRRPGAGERA
jgi:putative hydrolase of HD superfamily